MKRNISILIFLLFITAVSANSQNYVQTPVVISKEKVRNNGKIYYSHIVMEKQTLFSIAKAYGVTVQEIDDANPLLDLKKEGLKKNQILLIPVKSSQNAQNVTTDTRNTAEPIVNESKSSKDDYFYHIVKWYEDLDDIAKKYNIPADVIMRFNGMKDKTVRRKQKIKIPTAPEAMEKQMDSENENRNTIDEKASAGGQTYENSSEYENGGLTFRLSRPNVKATLLLPLNTEDEDKVNDNSMDFYCGALLAVRDLGKEGIGTDLAVYDIGGQNSHIPQDKIKSSDMVIGPFSSSEIVKTLDLCPPSTFIISPLDPKAGYLAYSHNNVIQAPTPYENQYKDIAEWIKEDTKTGDKIILLSEKGAKSPASANTIKENLIKSGISFKTVSYTIFESRNVYDMLKAVMDKESANRVIIASESEAFANDAVRNLSLMEHDGFNVILYSPSKILTFDTIEVDNYHKVNMHVSASYFIDYDDPEVEKFVLDYRSLFNTEPTQFAFQGYDIAHYFIKLYSDYGKHFPVKMNFEKSALQSDFKMKKAGNGGYINSAVRRFVYNPDYTVTEVRPKEEFWHWQ